MLSKKILILFLILIGFIEIKMVKADNMLGKFNEKLEYYLKDNGYNNVKIQPKNENGQQYVELTFYTDSEMFTSLYIYKDGIISYTLKSSIGNIDEFNKLLQMETKVMLSIILAFADIRGYDQDDFIEWSYSLSNEQLKNLSIEQDGISMKREEITQDYDGVKSSMTYTTELNLDLVNGIKSYTFKPQSEIVYDNKDNSNLEETKDYDKETKTKTNKFNLIYLIPILCIIDLIGIVVILHKRKSYKEKE